MKQFYTHIGKFLCTLALIGCSGSIPMQSALVVARKIDDLSGLISAGSADFNPVGA